MPGRNIHHDCVRNALQKDGWIITHDPLRLTWGSREMYVDLGAEQLLVGKLLVQHKLAQFIAFDPQAEVLVQWLP